MSITVTFSGNSSELYTTFFPEIVLDPEAEYECSLLDFTTYNSIPNVNESNNKLYFYTDNIHSEKKITIPIGVYEFTDIASYLKEEFSLHDVSFSLTLNKNTFKCEIQCSANIVFRNDCINQILGFNSQTLAATKIHQSEKILNITDLNFIRIECNIITNSYSNGEISRVLHEFPLQDDPGFKIVEVPRNLIYLPVVPKQIKSIQISIKDQKNRIVNFRGENIACRIHIRKVPGN